MGGKRSSRWRRGMSGRLTAVIRSISGLHEHVATMRDAVSFFVSLSFLVSSREAWGLAAREGMHQQAYHGGEKISADKEEVRKAAHRI